MVIPPFLKQGDRIGIVAPARKITPKELRPALRILNQWGLEAVFSKNLFGEENQYSGSDVQRAQDLQVMLDEESIRCVLCARGGYGILRIIDLLDFTAFRKKPKWVVGFSDVTVLHNHLQQLTGIASLHAMMPLNITNGKKMEARTVALESLKNVLFGKMPEYKLPPHPLNRAGDAEGELCGGNLSLLYSLQGSRSEPDTKGKILFLEDLDEYLYHIDRMMVSLRRAGKFSNLKGLIIGGMTRMHDNKIPFGKTAEEIVSDNVKDFGFPVCFGFPAGHLDDNRALVLGSKVRLTVEKNKTVIKF